MSSANTNSDKVLLEFTLNGHKHTYFKRIDMYGKPVTTNNVNNARKVKKNDVKSIITFLIKEYGKSNITDFNWQ